MPVVYENYGHRKRHAENAHRYAWKVLAWREDPHCRNCGRLTHLMLPVDIPQTKNSYKVIATCDHVLSRGMGGTDTEENFQLLCGRCNVKKSRLECPNNRKKLEQQQKQQGEPA